MRSTWLRQTTMRGIRISTFVGVGLLIQPVSAWQFRDLDQAAQSASSLIDLVPTAEDFVAPVIDADQVTNEVFQQAKITAGSAKAVAKAATDVVATPKVLVRPEPIPMPELNTEKHPRAASVETSQPAAGQAAAVAAAQGEHPLDAFADTTDVTSDTSTDLRAAEFNGVRPGTTRVAQLEQSWGGPTKRITNQDGTETLIYQVPSFKQLDVSVRDDLVTSLLVHLETPLPASQVEQELELTTFAAVPVPDEFGEVLGQAYPERGLMFSFTEDVESLNVAAILLEPLSGEMFRLRAQHDFDHHYQRSITDLAEAIRLDPRDSEAHWLEAEVLDTVGRTREALKSVNKAIRLRPTNPLYRLTRARLYAKTNQYQVAVDEVQEVLAELEMPNEVEARAQALLGDLKAMGPDADHQEAMKFHLKAIDLAAKAVDDRRFFVRRMAKQTLIDAHISVARDIAMGNFQRQAEVVPKWLLRATELADEFMTEDYGDPLLQMHVFRDTLASYAELQEASFDAAIASEEAIKTGKRLIAEASDELYKIQVERLLAETLLHSARISRSRGRYDEAMKIANNALALIDASKDQWEETTHDRYLRGQLCFLVGSIYAVQRDDHQEAAAWYAKALETAVDSNFVSPLYTPRNQGEMYVSMGLTQWEIGEQQQAIELTRKGAELMEAAVEKGSLLVAALAVPYGNLATMHGKLGDNSKSQEFAKLVAKVEQTVLSQKR